MLGWHRGAWSGAGSKLTGGAPCGNQLTHAPYSHVQQTKGWPDKKGIFSVLNNTVTSKGMS